MGSALGGGWWFLAAVLVVPLSVNVVNFMDGINGITSLTIACWGVTALLVGNADRIPTLALIGRGYGGGFTRLPTLECAGSQDLPRGRGKLPPRRPRR